MVIAAQNAANIGNNGKAHTRNTSAGISFRNLYLNLASTRELG